MDIQDYFVQEKLGTQKTIPFDTRIETFLKGSKIVEFGEIEKNIYYLISGKAISYVKSPKSDKIMEFLFAGDMFSSLTSMIRQKPSDVYVTCLSKCVIQIIPYTSLKEACKTSIFANTFFNHFVVSSYISRVQKEKDNLTKEPEQRYKELLKTRPNIFQEVPMARIAVYLGIHPNSLGRIRKRLIHNEKNN